MALLCKGKGSRKILLRGLNENGLYKLHHTVFPCRSLSSSSNSQPFQTNSKSTFSHVSSRNASALVGERTSLQNWHFRLGHPAFRLYSSVLSKFHLPVFNNKEPLTCHECHMSKSHQLPFSQSSNRVRHPLELIYTDVWGASPLSSTAGNKYYVSFFRCP
jgi:hypothetical protein